LGRDSLVTLALLAVPALVLLALVGGALLVFRRSVEPRTAAGAVLALVLALLVAAVGITLFEAAASSYRPYGEGVMRRTETYREWVELGFAVLYAGLVLLAIAAGWLVGRSRGGRAMLVAAVAGIGVVAYLTATLPFVEFLNACNVGGPIFTDEYVHC
jgi:hypothetical protein